MSLSRIIVPDQFVSLEIADLLEINGAHSIEINSPTTRLGDIACCRIVYRLMRLYIKPKASGLVLLALISYSLANGGLAQI